ncbi:hypothetical protein K488DRAFT_92421 [Vararia minispora EC-137]|uniref:Uncharacterized protein n=1 Tax=Vararia minispora EC-137 TaxID=1314806 RepID=A0ACB8Q474_9AGAM|nr:hypothetical protein K488DRAFT_92421 [Vararia minispora EC-137]
MSFSPVTNSTQTLTPPDAPLSVSPRLLFSSPSTIRLHRPARVTPSHPHTTLRRSFSLPTHALIDPLDFRSLCLPSTSSKSRAFHTSTHIMRLPPPLFFLVALSTPSAAPQRQLSHAPVVREEIVQLSSYPVV